MLWIYFIYARTLFGICGIKGVHASVSNVEQQYSAETGWVISCIILHETQVFCLELPIPAYEK